MADLKISQLSDGGNSQATDEYVIARSGNNFRIDGASIAAAATSVGTLTSLTVSGVTTLSAGTASAPALTTSGDTNNGIYFPAVDVVAVTTGGTERLRVDASGNLGLGVTPSAWVNTWRAIQINGNSGHAGTLYGNAGGTTGGIGLAQNWYWNGTNNLYLTDAAASDFAMLGGGFLWRTASTGTAGNAVTLNTAMELNVSGNLGVGTTPVERLTVANTGTSDIASVYRTQNSGSSLFGLVYAANNASNNKVNYAGIYGRLVTSTASSESGDIAMYTRNAGTFAERLRITTAGIVQGTQVTTKGPYIGSGTSITVADDSTVQLPSSQMGASLVCVYEDSNGYGGVAMANYNQAAVLVANGGQFAASDTDGFLCVYKSAGQHTTYVKNRLGGTYNLYIGVYAATAL